MCQFFYLITTEGVL